MEKMFDGGKSEKPIEQITVISEYTDEINNSKRSIKLYRQRISLLRSSKKSMTQLN